MERINKKVVVVPLILFCFLFANLGSKNQFLSSQDYITGDDGEIRMNVNIIGHVRYPGAYLVYDGINILQALSVAGGFLQGSDLKNIIIFSKDGDRKDINLNKGNLNNVVLLPHDTVIINEKIVSQMLTSSNLPYIILGILNVALTLSQE